jgi:hypothetical protein
LDVQENKKNLQFERSRFDELQGRFEHMMLEHMQQAEKRDHDHSEALRVSLSSPQYTATFLLSKIER